MLVRYKPEDPSQPAIGLSFLCVSLGENQGAVQLRKPATLYFDGACPLCSAEIDRLQKASDGSLRTLDIHTLSPDERVDVDEFLKTLHYVSPDGDVLLGLDANVAAWQHTRWGFAFRWLRWPLVRSIASGVYDAWARWRYRRLYGD
jgi:predicted DCC family thiol-disulfide oxidoreductase YuxK